MSLEPKISEFNSLLILGKNTRMSILKNKTRELWQSFMPHLANIENKIGSDLYSIEVYNHSFFNSFNPENEFTKWAGVAISQKAAAPPGFEYISLPKGLYAIFRYKGKASEASSTYQYIYNQWLPGSDFLLDDRPHFCLMGKLYKHEDPLSEEDIFIPIKRK